MDGSRTQNMYVCMHGGIPEGGSFVDGSGGSFVDGSGGSFVDGSGRLSDGQHSSNYELLVWVQERVRE